MKTKKLIRKLFRDSVFERDGHQCRKCEIKDNLDAHHITDRNEMPNGGYVLSNGITLCQKHHLDAEQFHISGGRKWVDGFHPSDLYELIHSSHDIAVRDSQNLSSV